MRRCVCSEQSQSFTTKVWATSIGARCYLGTSSNDYAFPQYDISFSRGNWGLQSCSFAYLFELLLQC